MDSFVAGVRLFIFRYKLLQPGKLGSLFQSDFPPSLTFDADSISEANCFSLQPGKLGCLFQYDFTQA